MTNPNHCAIFISNNIDKRLLIQNILEGKILKEIIGKKIITFSEITLKEFIEFEDRFGNLDFMKNTNRSIITLSGGEQKKALLNYCLSQNPDYLILDNPFDNLDIASQLSLKEQINAVSSTINIIQLVNRTDDLLSFIGKCKSIEDDGKIVEYASIKDYFKKSYGQIVNFSGDIPEPFSKYILDYEHLVLFDSVTVKYGEKTIIKNIDWKIKPREYWQLVGPNGSGKTTMLSMIIGDNPKGFGQKMTLFDKLKGSGEAVWDIKKLIGYFTPSMVNLFARTTSVEHMLVSGIFDSIGLYKIPTERQLRLANEWLKVLNFQKLKTTAFYKLTIGQQRLIMIARAMIKHPPLLILDEPIAGLDDHNAYLVCSLINKIADESETAIIYVSHRKEEGLEPEFVFELIPSEQGSTGTIKPQIG